MARANLALSRMAIVSPPPDLLRPNPGFRSRGDCRFLSVAYHPPRRGASSFFPIFLPRTDRIEAPHRRKRGIVARDRDAESLAMHVADFRYHRYKSKMRQLSGKSTRPAVDDERASRREARGAS